MRFYSTLLMFIFGCATSRLALGAPAAPPVQGRSVKKVAADTVAIKPPQVLEQSDIVLGFRASQGQSFEHQPALGVALEKMLTPNFGLGAEVKYATYQIKMSVGPMTGTWDYKALAIGVSGSFHFDLFNVKNLDTSISAGVGRTSLKSSWSSNMDLPSPGQAQTSTTYLMAAVQARYFLNSRWAFTGGLSVPGGALALGMDYLF